MTAPANNFNLLRLAFALMVAAYHLVFLSGVEAWSGSIRFLSVLAEIGVQGFFVLSGFLVYASLDRSTSLLLYAEKRVRRLYPAYAVVILACTLAACALSHEARGDLAAVGRYVAANLAFANFLQPSLPGIFASPANIVPEVNGALWTLKIEVMFYLVLPLLAWLLRVSGRARWVVIVLVYAGAEVWRLGLGSIDQAELSRQLPGQMSFFITGMALHRLQWTGMRMHLTGIVGAALLTLTLLVPDAEPLRAIGLGCLAVWMAISAVRLPDAARFGDLSYGLYIVHFPVIQTVAALGLFASSAWLGAGVAAIASLAAALILWHFVEKPWLRSDSPYRAASA